jgi:hypothetical protein
MLDLDASYNEYGPNLSSNLAPCFLVPIILKCSKLVIMQAQTLLDSSALACYMYKKLMQQYKLVIMEKNAPLLVEVIDG